MVLPQKICFSLPEWLHSSIDLDSPRESDDARMDLAIELARRNVEHGGGPFGALVFDADTGKVVAPGVNLVVPQGCSLLHAEVVAIVFAEARLQSYALSGARYELVTSSDPCVQCLGACHWAGLSRLVCGAPLSAAEAAGFDEGPRAPDWAEQLMARGTQVVTSVRAEQARAVLAEYASRGLPRYNGRSSGAGGRDRGA
jgi:tRNA(Arg) A34 adenosine deaminase TadA